MKEHWTNGTLTARSRCWAQGMDSWKALHQIPQLKWSLLASGQPVMNETDLAITVLNMLKDVCKLYPSR